MESESITQQKRNRMQYKLTIYDANYGTENQTQILTEVHDDEPTSRFIIDSVIEQGGQVAVIECGQGSEFQVQSIYTIK